MAYEKHLAILKQGVEGWNKWREDLEKKARSNHEYQSLLDLAGNLTDIRKANLHGIELREINLSNAEVNEADLSATDLTGANLVQADLEGVDFSNAILIGANLRGAHLSRTNFSKSLVLETIFGNSDLSEVIGLEDVIHQGPSTIGVDTIAKSKGKIPKAFLQGCGLSDWEIEQVKLYDPILSNDEITQIQYRIYELRATQALQISPLFISYSQKDGKFVDKLESQLNSKGIRFWRDVHDATSGRLEKQISRAIQLNPTVLLILSEHSLKSDWVEHEVRTARELEKEIGRDVLCPVALDDSWKDSRWPKRIMEQVMEYPGLS